MESKFMLLLVSSILYCWNHQIVQYTWISYISCITCITYITQISLQLIENKKSKIAPNVGNERSLWGLQTGRWQKLGSCSRNRIFWPKTKISGPRKHPLLNSNHVLATTGKSCSKKKVPFSKIDISLLRNFRWFFGIKCISGQKKHFSAEPKNGRFSVIPARTRSIVILGHFFEVSN